MISVLAHFGSLALISLTGFAIFHIITAETIKERTRWLFWAINLIMVTLIYFALFLPR